MADRVLPVLQVMPIRLDRNNYSYWRLQVLSTARAHSFEKVLLGDSVAPERVIDETGDDNPDYIFWMRKDQLIFSWLISSITEQMLGSVSRYNTSAEIWSTLDALFRSQSCARIQHYLTQLYTVKKGDIPIAEYILKIQSIVDAIQAAERVVTEKDLIMHVLSGLGPEYESIVINLNVFSSGMEHWIRG